uniref:Podocan n=1 Tax=Latimeria chalumnae TaxID=7897 RepID=H3A8F4_LATCH
RPSVPFAPHPPRIQCSSCTLHYIMLSAWLPHETRVVLTVQMALSRESLLLLCFLTFSFGVIQCQMDEDNEFPKEVPVLQVKPAPGSVIPGCPADCTCTVEGTVDCGGVDLKEFPRNLPEFTLHLSLQNNQIERIPKEELLRLHKLETLNLQNNRLTIKGIPEDAFESLENLSYLYLANNKLIMAPKSLPNTLISADFAANFLTKIYPHTFGQKPNLGRAVYLHNNKLTDAGLPDSMFNGSANVDVLVLSSNFLKCVPKNLPPALGKLHLRNNRLEKIPHGAFDNLQQGRDNTLRNRNRNDKGKESTTHRKLSGLIYLDLSSNNLTQIPKGLPRNIVLLHLEKNAIKTIAKDVLVQIKNLEYLLLHNNKLEAKGIHPQAFLGLKKLHTVYLYNNMLERVPSGLPRRVNSLMLLHNQISEISRNDFATTYFITELNLSYNKLTSLKIHREAFRKLKLLESLDLSGNSLHTVPKGLPKNLRILRLKENEIGTIPDGAFSKMNTLKALFLSNNKLKTSSFYPGTWQELINLQVLDLSGNQLSYVPSDLPESLEYLYLQRNKIHTIFLSTFESTPNIKAIFLRRFNRLTADRIHNSAFENLKNLQVLDIEGNFKSTATDSSKEKAS